MTRFLDFPVRGADLSVYDGTTNWSIVAQSGLRFVIIRAGWGKQTDKTFSANWAGAGATGIYREVYYYMNYYSNHDSSESVYGISDEEWGKIQAENCWNIIRPYSDSTTIWLDIESASPSFSPPIDTVWARAETIARAFIKRIKELSGKACGIYTSASVFKKFSDDFRDLPAWVAWYTRTQTRESIIEYMRKAGWRGEILYWQLASDGDVDQDGDGDGRLLGLARDVADLDVWMKTELEFTKYAKKESTTPMATFLYYPVDRGFRISQYFGANPSWTAYQASGGHNGIDWAVPVGNKIYAAQDGTVIRAEEINYGYGRHVRIESADGTTIYGHLSALKVKTGDKVSAKQVIGLSGGATSDPFAGFSTGPHLHFEYRPKAGAPKVAGGLEGALDPLPLLVSHNYPNPDPVIPILFKARCTVASLNVRNAPNATATVVDGVGYNQIKDVYEISENWYRIDAYQQMWCSATYMEKVEGTGDPAPVEPTPTPEPAPVSKTVEVRTVVIASLNVRKSASLLSAKVESLSKGQKVEVLETEGDWIRIGYNQWCLTKYAGVPYVT